MRLSGAIMEKFSPRFFLWMPLCICGIISGGNATSEDAQKNSATDFYQLPMEKRIEDLEARQKKLNLLNAEEKEIFNRQLHETILLTVHNIIEDSLKTVRGMASSIAPQSVLTLAPIEKLADFVYLFDTICREIGADKGAYKENLRKLYWASRCLGPDVVLTRKKVLPAKDKMSSDRQKARENILKKCRELECTSKKKCLALALNYTAEALKPFSKMFAEGTEINEQYIDNGLILMGKVVLPVLTADAARQSPIGKELEKMSLLIKLTISFLLKTRNMLMAAAEKDTPGIDEESQLTRIPGPTFVTTLGEMSPDLKKAQSVFNGIGLLANISDKFAQGLGKGILGNIASSCVYSVINLANMGTDIIGLIHADLFDKTIKRFECLLKGKDALIKSASTYKGTPGSDKSCPGIGCVDLATCHALTMLSLTKVIKPFIENFIGRAQIDSSGNPTNRLEMGLLINIGNALSEILEFLTSSKTDSKATELTRHRQRLSPLAGRLENFKNLIDKTRELEISLASIFPRLVEAFEQTALDISPEAARYIEISAAQRTTSEDLMAEEEVSDDVTGTNNVNNFDDSTFNEKILQEDYDELKKELKRVDNE